VIDLEILEHHSDADEGARDEHERPARGRRRRGPDRLIVLEPGTHPRLRDRFRDRRRIQPCGVIRDSQPLVQHVSRNRLETGELLEPLLEDGHFFVAVHPLDLENRLGVDFANLAGGSHQRRSSLTWRRPC
jgi:hypothetical protein